MHRRDSVLLTLSFPFPGSLALLLPLKKVICGETFCTSAILFDEKHAVLGGQILPSVSSRQACSLQWDCIKSPFHVFRALYKHFEHLPGNPLCCLRRCPGQQHQLTTNKKKLKQSIRIVFSPTPRDAIQRLLNLLERTFFSHSVFLGAR